MEPIEKFLKEVKSICDSCKEVYDEGMKKNEYNLVAHLVYRQLDYAINEYEKSVER